MSAAPLPLMRPIQHAVATFSLAYLMARLPRLDFEGIAQHVVQRANDRQPWFAEALDPLEAANQRAHTQQQCVWGSDRLRAQIEALIRRANRDGTGHAAQVVGAGAGGE